MAENEAEAPSFEVNTGATRTETGTEKNWLGMDKEVTTTVEDMNLRGIDATKVPEAQAAIATYVGKIDEILAQIKTVTAGNVETALKGTAQVSKVTEYVNATVDQIQRVTYFFEKFTEGLSKVAENYVAQDAAVTTSDVQNAEQASGVSADDNLSGVQPFGN